MMNFAACTKWVAFLLALTVAPTLVADAVAVDRSDNSASANTRETRTGAAPSGEVIRRAVGQLGSPDYGTRERAMLRLWRLGMAARPALVDAAAAGDPEIAVRARSILERLRWGLTPETPPETRRLIDQFRHGQVAVRQVLVSRLHDAGQDELAIRLISAVDDPAEQEQLIERWLDEASGGDFARGIQFPWLGGGQPSASDSSSAGKAVRNLLAREQYDLVDCVLRLRAGNPAKIRAYASFLLLTGRLAERMAEGEDGEYPSGPPVTPMQMVYFHRAAGDLETARELLAREGRGTSASGVALAIEAGAAEDLSQMALAAEASETREPGEPYGATGWALPAQLGLAAWSHRRAGREEAATEAVARIATTKSSDWFLAFRAAEALLVAGVPAEAVDVLRQHGNKVFAADLLIAQGRYDEVLLMAGLADPTKRYVLPKATREVDDFELDPFGELEGREERSDESKQCHLALRVARVLAELGYRDEAIDLFERLARRANAETGPNLVRVCRTECDAGLTDAARTHALQFGDPANDRPLRDALFGDHAAEAGGWWYASTVIDPDMAPEKRLEVVARLSAGRLPLEQRRRLAQRAVDRLLAEKHVSSNGDDQPVPTSPSGPGARSDERAPLEPRIEATEAQLLAVADVLRDLELPEAERRCRVAAARRFPGVASLSSLADFHTRLAEWSDATRAYTRVIETGKAAPVHFYMQGLCMSRTENASAGKRRIEKASLLLYDDPAARYAMAIALNERDRTDDAMRQWEIVARTAPANSRLVANASRRIGNGLSGDDPLRAAELWQVMLLGTLKPSDSLPEVTHYLKVGHLIHRLRARGFLADGNTSAAFDEARQAMELLPGEVDTVVDLVSRFDQRGAKAEADALFRVAVDHLSGILKRHPGADRIRSRLDEMGAACNRPWNDELSARAR